MQPWLLGLRRTPFRHAGQRLRDVTLNGNRLASCEPLPGSLNKRIRDLGQGPDGWIWVATDDVEIHRVIR